MYDLIIIGAGTAGLSAYVYAKRANLKVLVLEKNIHGGQIINSFEVENYLGLKKMSGVEFVNKIYEHANEFGLSKDLKYEEVIAINNNDKVIMTKNSQYNYKALIIATGALPKKLNIENEDQLIGKGISYCAYCDGAFFKGKDVAVIGGGNSALEDAIYLSTLCNKIYLIHRNELLRGENHLIEDLKNKDNIELLLDTDLISINKDEVLNSITISQDEITRTINISGLFVAIGRTPDTDLVKDIISIDEKGYIIADESCKTNIANIFVAGDVRTKEVRQLITAASDGAISAINANVYINNVKKGEK